MLITTLLETLTSYTTENSKFHDAVNNQHLVDWCFSYRLNKFFLKWFSTVFWTANGVGAD